MLKIFVDSGSSIKQEEKETYKVEIIPLKILIDGKEYEDGIDLTFDIFYDALINKDIFPKTSLPNLIKLEENVKECIKNGDDVLIITISSEISSTFSTIKMLFEDEPKVKVVDSRLAVGGIRLLVMEANKYREESLEVVVRKIEELIPRIRILAVPETLDYLHKGGRLSAMSFFVGKLLKIKPLITFKEGKVSVFSKERGLNGAMKVIVEELNKCDTKFKIIPSYTYNDNNLKELISRVDDQYKNAMAEYDNLDPAIASHWGPNAFGFIYVEKRID